MQLWVRGGNHLLIRGPRLEFAEIQREFQALEMPAWESLLAQPKRPRYEIVTRAFREDIAVYCVLPSAEAHSAAVEQLLQELRARGVPEIRATEAC